MEVLGILGCLQKASYSTKKRKMAFGELHLATKMTREQEIKDILKKISFQLTYKTKVLLFALLGLDQFCFL